VLGFSVEETEAMTFKELFGYWKKHLKDHSAGGDENG
jgi:hypothetical protein